MRHVRTARVVMLIAVLVVGACVVFAVLRS